MKSNNKSNSNSMPSSYYQKQQQDNDSDSYSSSSGESDASRLGEETIGLFGIQGGTGKEFVKLALDAGYSVQAVVPTGYTVELQHDSLKVITGTLEDTATLQQVVNGATYVVCMLGDTLPTKAKEYQQDFLLNFVKSLYPLMMESCTRLFLYQANSLTMDGTSQKKAPILSRVLKETGNLLGISPHNKDNDNAVKFIVKNDNEYFHYIVTRPGLLRQGPSKKKLAASKSLPGPVPMTHVDLAEFSLNALMEEKLYNTCPYVVGDGF